MNHAIPMRSSCLEAGLRKLGKGKAEDEVLMNWDVFQPPAGSHTLGAYPSSPYFSSRASCSALAVSIKGTPASASAMISKNAL